MEPVLAHNFYYWYKRKKLCIHTCIETKFVCINLKLLSTFIVLGMLPEVLSFNFHCKIWNYRKKLAFFAGSINSPVREKLIQYWRNDSEIFAHFGRVTTSYADELLGSKFCLQVKGFEVNTARIADSLYYGCVPVIIANHYDLPFAEILNWKSFSVVVATLDIPLLKKILKEISSDRYLLLQSNVMKVRKHFQWHLFPIDYDAFYMVLYELWLRRSSLGLRVQLSSSFDSYWWLYIILKGCFVGPIGVTLYKFWLILLLLKWISSKKKNTFKFLNWLYIMELLLIFL